MLKWGFNGFRGTFSCLHSFRSLIQYSTSSAASKDGITNPLVVDYLVKSVGFSEEEAVSIDASKYKVSLHSKSTKKLALVVDFLRSSGFDETQIRKLVLTVPRIFRSDVEKTLKPKIRVFQELGFCGSDIGTVISQHPHVLSRSLEAHIVPVLDMLKSLIGNNEELVSLLLKTKSQRLLSSNVMKNLPHNLLLLQNYGVPSQKIKQLILQRPLLLIQRTQWFKQKAKEAEEKLGIPRTSDMFLYGVSALSMIREERLESLFQVFLSYQWSKAEISALLRKHPLILNLSETILRAKLKYFMVDLGYGSDYLAMRPNLLSLSLEKRIKPRTAVIQALLKKNLLKRQVGLYTVMSRTDSVFVKKFVLPFKDKLPLLHEFYLQQKSSGKSLSKT